MFGWIPRFVQGLGGSGDVREPPDAPDGGAIDSVRRYKGPLAAAAFSSSLINVLALTGAMFMLQVYDRVLPSGSVATLQALVVLMMALYGFQATLEIIRSRIFVRIGVLLEQRLAGRVFEAYVAGAASGTPAITDRLFGDLGKVRAFLAGGGPSALFDLPWIPIFIGLLVLLHPWLGAMAIAGALLLLALTWVAELRTREPQTRLAEVTREAGMIAAAARRNSELVSALGLTKDLRESWAAKNRLAVEESAMASDIIGFLGGLSRYVRFALQSLVLAVGAVLVIDGQASGGIMIAASILLGRALAPVELVISHWRAFIAARQGYDSLVRSLARDATESQGFSLPLPSATVEASGLAVTPPGRADAAVRDIAFRFSAGDIIGVIGPSGAGKSTLVRGLVGAWPVSGELKFDGSSLDQWSSADRGRFLGYMPQSTELIAGTIAQNIARFDPNADACDVLKAASAAGIEAMIRAMPDGFDTQVGEGGRLLSVGQRQRISLARALYRDPFFVLLDEPSSAMDGEGEAALLQAMLAVSIRGGIVVIIAHRPSALRVATKVLMLADGVQRAFGPREEVLRPRPSPNKARAMAEVTA